MTALQTIAVAFAMFSALPMPQFDWNAKNMRYALCAFPLVGAVCGALWCLCGMLPLPALARAAGFCLVPVWVTGGIHLDGYADTCDALSTYGDTAKKLEILKDPHVGAFGVMACCGYLLASFALWGQVYETPRLIGLCCIGFFLSRCCSALAVVSFPAAKNSGLAHLFSSYADKKTVRVCCGFYLLLAGALLVWKFLWLGAAVLITIGFVFGGVWHLCRKQFGGITGDLAGFFLQVAELAVLAVCTCGGIMG